MSAMENAAHDPLEGHANPGDHDGDPEIRAVGMIDSDEPGGCAEPDSTELGELAVGDEPEAMPEDPKPEERPDWLGDEWWDASSGTIRAQALHEAYVALQEEAARRLPRPDDVDDAESFECLYDALGRPATAAEYRIEPASPLIENDDVVNERLHEAGLSQRQAQIVYDIAAEVLVPSVMELVGKVRASEDHRRLHERFGGEKAWTDVARQLATWGKAHLDPQNYQALASSYEGVLALVEMMKTAEPQTIDGDGVRQACPDADELREMVNDPRYWRERDPEFIARVTDGFKYVYTK